MKAILYSLLALLLIGLQSCEGQSGYLDEGQESTLSMLTEKEWLMVYSDTGFGNEQTYDNETSMYFFNIKGNGWVALGSLKDETVKKNTTYFQWTFTNENFVVVQLAGNGMDGYWLIKKLTPAELWVQWTIRDPVLHPNQDPSLYKFRTRK